MTENVQTEESYVDYSSVQETAVKNHQNMTVEQERI